MRQAAQKSGAPVHAVRDSGLDLGLRMPLPRVVVSQETREQLERMPTMRAFDSLPPAKPYNVLFPVGVNGFGYARALEDSYRLRELLTIGAGFCGPAALAFALTGASNVCFSPEAVRRAASAGHQRLRRAKLSDVFWARTVVFENTTQCERCAYLVSWR